MTSDERSALGAIITSIHNEILTIKDERERIERRLEDLAYLEKSALFRAATVNSVLEAANPYRKGGPKL